jgi:hypothetical protein
VVDKPAAARCSSGWILVERSAGMAAKKKTPAKKADGEAGAKAAAKKTPKKTPEKTAAPAAKKTAKKSVETDGADAGIKGTGSAGRRRAEGADAGTKGTGSAG